MSRTVPPWFLAFGAAVAVIVVLLVVRRGGGDTEPTDASGSAQVAPETASGNTGAGGAPGAGTPAPTGLEAMGAPQESAANRIQRHAEAFGLEPGSALMLKNVSVQGDLHHYRYGQSHLGVPVEGVGLTLSEDARGRIDHVFGQPARGLNRPIPTIAPKLDAQQAIPLALKAWLGEDYTRHAPRDEAAMLVVHVGPSDAHLAYRVTFSADSSPKGGPTSPWVLVDANSGAILSREENLQTLGGG